VAAVADLMAAVPREIGNANSKMVGFSY
jgi:hypothetical protein